MPEGDTIRRPASTMNKLFTGGSILAFSSQGRFTASAEKINERVLERIHVHDRYMFIGFVPPEAVGNEPQEWMRIHLSLYGWQHLNGDESVVDESHGITHRIAPIVKGEWDGHFEARWDEGYGQAAKGEWEPPESVGQVRFRTYNEHATADLIGPSCCELISNEERIAAQAKLSPDPLDEGVRENQEVARRFAKVTHVEKCAIGEVVMDQTTITGVGDICRADALFLARISPYRRGSNISVKRLIDLWVLICDLMSRGLAAGRLETMGPLEVPNPSLEGDEEVSCWYVCYRTGRFCLRCDTPVREALMQNCRLLWYPSCQR